MKHASVVGILGAVALTWASNVHSYPWYVRGTAAITDWQGNSSAQIMVWFDPASKCRDAYLITTGHVALERTKFGFNTYDEALGSIWHKFDEVTLEPISGRPDATKVRLAPNIMYHMKRAVAVTLNGHDGKNARYITVELGGQKEGNSGDAINGALAECEARSKGTDGY